VNIKMLLWRFFDKMDGGDVRPVLSEQWIWVCTVPARRCFFWRQLTPEMSAFWVTSEVPFQGRQDRF
jgi:hypothetical protein